MADRQLARRRPRRGPGDRDVEQRGPAGVGPAGPWLGTAQRVTSRGEEPVSLAARAVLIGQRIARGDSRERAGHVEPGRGAVMGSSACSTSLRLIHANCSARPSFSSFVVGCALVRARPGSSPIRTSVRRPILRARRSAGSSYRPSAASATQRRHLGQCGAGKQTRGRADECLTPRAGQSSYRRIGERELTRTVMQRRELTHPTRRQMHCSAPAPACGRLVDIRVMHVQPVAPSTG